MIALLLLALLQSVLILELNRNRLRKKEDISLLQARQRMLEERLRDRTEKWRAASETHELASRRHEQTTALLNETKEYLNSIIHSMPSMLIGVTPSGYVTHWNRATELATQRREAEVLGHRVDEAYPQLPHVLDWIHHAIEQELPLTHENLRMPGEARGEEHYYDITVFPLVFSNNSGAVIRIDDVSLRVRLENMMVQSEKMLSLGGLAAGMAHEINNPLAAIVQSVQNIQRRLDPDNPHNIEQAKRIDLDLQRVRTYLQQRDILRFLQGIQEAGSRAAGIVNNMLEFSRGSSRIEPAVDLQAVLRHATDFFMNSLKMSHPEQAHGLKIELQQPAMPLPLIPCNSSEIQQVIVNLLKNSSDASLNLPEARRHIHLSTHLLDHIVRIQIQDHGQGMSEEVRRHIFDPFYTTKDIGQGTGLGLSISYFIITERHQGQIEVKSRPGLGTLFNIDLPLRRDDDPKD